MQLTASHTPKKPPKERPPELRQARRSTKTRRRLQLQHVVFGSATTRGFTNMGCSRRQASEETRETKSRQQKERTAIEVSKTQVPKWRGHLLQVTDLKWHVPDTCRFLLACSPLVFHMWCNFFERGSKEKKKKKKKHFISWKVLFFLVIFFHYSFSFTFQRWFLELEVALPLHFKSLKMKHIWWSYKSVFGHKHAIDNGPIYLNTLVHKSNFNAHPSTN
jgi:hypothetical protein